MCLDSVGGRGKQGGLRERRGALIGRGSDEISDLRA